MATFFSSVIDILKIAMGFRVHRFVFIIAIGRSGSTLLQGVLNAIPGACVRGENCGLTLTLFYQYQNMKVQQNAITQRSFSPIGAWYGAAEWCLDQFFKKCWKIAHHEIFRFPFKSDLIGYKEIRFPFNDDEELVDYCNFLRTLEPNSLILFNVRDAIAISKSGWWPTELDAMSEITARKRAIEIAALRVPNSLLLDYSEYSDNPALLTSRLRTVGIIIPEEIVRNVFSIEHSYNGNRYTSWV